MFNLTDLQLTCLVIVALVLLFILGNCKLTCSDYEGYTSRIFSGPSVAYPDKGGNMLQGWVRDNAKRVGDYSCQRCMKSALSRGVDRENACLTCTGYGDCDSAECGYSMS